MAALMVAESSPKPIALAVRAEGAEEELARRAAAGDMGAFDALVVLLGTRVFSVAVRILGDRGEAEDLAQEVFVALHHALPGFRGESRVSTWVYRITHNRALNRLKFLKRRKVGALDDVDDEAIAHRISEPGARATGAGERRLASKELSVLVEKFIRALPDEQRALVVMRDVEDLSYEEIAEATGLTLGTVKSRLHRARLELAKNLAPHLDDVDV